MGEPRRLRVRLFAFVAFLGFRVEGFGEGFVLRGWVELPGCRVAGGFGVSCCLTLS